jgi:hypothetical protein
LSFNSFSIFIGVKKMDNDRVHLERITAADAHENDTTPSQAEKFILRLS